jgi:hypothetical protein
VYVTYPEAVAECHINVELILPDVEHLLLTIDDLLDILFLVS